jgi:hypothetical protein
VVQSDPFTDLGLPALAELTDDDVRAAWRRIAAATHPDREDGGDPARFGAAAAAYAALRTSFGRGEALADLAAGAARGRSRRARRARRPVLSWHPHRLWSLWRPWPLRRPWSLRRLWYQQRVGAHRLHAATPATGARPGAATASARPRPAARPAGPRHAGNGGFLQAVYTRFRPSGGPRYQQAGVAGVGKGLALPAGGATLGAAAAIAAVGWTPATIGLVAGALTVTAWGLWRRAGRDR